MKQKQVSRHYLLILLGCIVSTIKISSEESYDEMRGISPASLSSEKYIYIYDDTNVDITEGKLKVDTLLIRASDKTVFVTLGANSFIEGIKQNKAIPKIILKADNQKPIYIKVLNDSIIKGNGNEHLPFLVTKPQGTGFVQWNVFNDNALLFVPRTSNNKMPKFGPKTQKTTLTGTYTDQDMCLSGIYFIDRIVTIKAEEKDVVLTIDENTLFTNNTAGINILQFAASADRTIIVNIKKTLVFKSQFNASFPFVFSGPGKVIFNIR